MNSQEKSILQILAVHHDYCSQEDLIKCLKQLNINTDNEIELTKSVFSKLIGSMQRRGYIKKTAKGVCCHQDFIQSSLLEVLKNNQFEDIRLVIKNINSPTNRFSYSSSLTLASAGRECIINLFTSKKELNSTQFMVFSKDRWRREIEPDPLGLLKKSPLNTELIDYIPQINRIAFLEHLLHFAEAKPDIVKQGFEHLYKLYLTTPNTNQSPSFILNSLLMRYRLDDMRQLLATLEDNGSETIPAYSGCLEFVLNNNATALTLFNQAVSRIKKQTRKRNTLPKGLPGVFFLLALLKSGNNELLNQGLTHITNIPKSETPQYHKVIKNLKSVFQDQLGLPSSEQVSIYLHSNVPTSIIEYLFISLTLWWSDKKMAKKNIPSLEKIRDESVPHEYLFIIGETANLLAAMNHEVELNNEYFNAIKAIYNTPPLTDLIVPTEKWRKTLRQLINLDSTANSATDNTENNQRLVWFFNYHDKWKTHSITPRLQKRGKNGKWSKGRNVALKTLYDQYSYMEGLSEQDNHICSYLNEHWERSGFYRNRNRYHEFENDNLLPAMIGHPLIFLEDSPGTLVEFVKGEPELQVKKNKGKLSISLTPNPQNSTSDTILIKESPTRFKVIQFTKKHREIAELIGDEFQVPKSGFDMAKQAAAALSGSITVLSDVGGGQEVEEVAADPTPHIHLLPHNSGLKLNMLTKPLEEGQSCFTPGKGGITVLAEIKGKRVQAKRNLKQEVKLCNKVVQACPTLTGFEDLEDELLLNDPLECLEVLQELKNCPEKVVLEWPQGERFKTAREVSFNNFSLEVKKDRDWFKATGTLQVDESLVFDLQKLLAMLEHSTGRFVTLDDGTYLALTKQLQKQLEELRAYSHKSGKGVRFNPLASLALDSMFDECPNLKQDKAWKDHVARLSEVVDPQLPSTLQADLRDYQLTGYKWLGQLSHWNVGACLADDMGLGKTLQALSVILTRTAHGPTLVVAPLSVMNNWCEEAARFRATT
ncbi:MAG: SNF2-related protein, partial [Desulfobulbaceae bacterium]|nr:SNF2-related protein [Desulfobulbaceae bacterium]